MKKIFFIIALLGIIVFASPKFIGGIVETEYQSELNKLNDNPAITIKSTAFNRNWFTGKVVTEMAVLVQHEELDKINITIEDDISFGPLIFTDKGMKLGLSYSKYTINFIDLFIDEEIKKFIKNNVHLSGLLTFSKDIITHVVIDEVDKKVDGNKIMSAKATGQFTLENESRLYGDFHWGGLSINTTTQNIVVNNIDFSVDQKLQSGNFYQGNAISTGSGDFSISAIKVKNSIGNEIFSLNNLLINAMSSVSDNLMEIKVNYSADKLASAGKQLKNANLDITFTRLNITVLQEINTFLTELSGSEAVLSSENMNKISTLTAKLLVHDPVITITDLSVEAPEGKIESTMRVNIDEKLFDKNNIMSIMTAINATANGKAPMALFANLGLASIIKHYIDQGLIIRKEENIMVNVKYIQGQISINGNIIQL